MTHRYQTERPLTLSEAKVIFGYTSDHLAYLCRNGFVWAQRHGRAWLTCESAVADYKRALELAGKPVGVREHGRVLRAHRRFSFNFDLDSAEEAWNRFVDCDLIPTTSIDRDPLHLMLACEKLETESRPRGFWTGVFEADLAKWFLDCAGAYKGIITVSRFTPNLLPRGSKRCLNVRLAQPPAGLPTGRLPAYLGSLAWYRQEAVLVPAVSVVLALFFLNTLNFLPIFLRIF